MAKDDVTIKDTDKGLKAIDIKGKAYVPVNERIRYFRENYPDGRIITHILDDSDNRVVFRAEVYLSESLVATGHAYENQASSFINKTSYIENAETSAIGRALGVFGIGIEDSVASAEELANAMLQQKTKEQIVSEKEDAQIDGETLNSLKAKIADLNPEFLPWVLKKYSVAGLEALSMKQVPGITRDIGKSIAAREKANAKPNEKKPTDELFKDIPDGDPFPYSQTDTEEDKIGGIS